MAAYSFCTVCGVKLSAKNKISYRPNSCRDCELERKRLYSLKRKEDNIKRTKSTGKKTTAKKTKKVTSKSKAKPTKKTTAKKATTSRSKVKSKDQVKREKEKEKLKLQREREREKLQKQREREKLKKEKEREKLRKQREREKLKKEKERERDRLRKEREREQAKKQKEKDKLLRIKEKEKLKIQREKDKELRKIEREQEKERKRLEKEAEKEEKKREKEEAKRKADEEKREKARRKKLLEMNIITDVPAYAFSAASSKVKKRRLTKNKSDKKEQIIHLDTQTKLVPGENLKLVPFNPEAEDKGEVLRAPSDTPWEGSNFKIVDGIFVAHTDNDADESRGPTEDEVKAIIERIRQEHKTRKD